jgi:hypothetical protein
MVVANADRADPGACGTERIVLTPRERVILTPLAPEDGWFG